MPFNVKDFFEMGSSIGETDKSALDVAGGNLAESFKKKKEIDYEVDKTLEIEKRKRALPLNEKERAETNLLNSRSAWMQGIGNRPDVEDLVLDSYGQSGPRYINANARLEQKTLGEQASQLPKLDRALVAVQSLKAQYQKSLSPVSIEKGSNPFIGFVKKQKQGIGENIGSVSGSNPEMNRYKANKEGFASLISKGGFMEAGVLTNEDIKRITNILPSEFSSEQEANIAWSEIEGILSSARKQFESNRAAIDGTQNSNQQPEESNPDEEAMLADFYKRNGL